MASGPVAATHDRSLQVVAGLVQQLLQVLAGLLVQQLLQVVAGLVQKLP